MHSKRLKSYWIGTLVLLLIMMVFGLASIFSFFYISTPVMLLFPLSFIVFIPTLQKRRVAYYFNLAIGVIYTLVMFVTFVDTMFFIAKYASDPESLIYYPTLGWLRYFFLALIFLVPFVLFLILTWKSKPLFFEVKTVPAQATK